MRLAAALALAAALRTSPARPPRPQAYVVDRQLPRRPAARRLRAARCADGHAARRRRVQPRQAHRQLPVLVDRRRAHRAAAVRRRRRCPARWRSGIRRRHAAAERASRSSRPSYAQRPARRRHAVVVSERPPARGIPLRPGRARRGPGLERAGAPLPDADARAMAGARLTTDDDALERVARRDRARRTCRAATPSQTACDDREWACMRRQRRHAAHRCAPMRDRTSTAARYQRESRLTIRLARGRAADFDAGRAFALDCAERTPSAIALARSNPFPPEGDSMRISTLRRGLGALAVGAALVVAPSAIRPPRRSSRSRSLPTSRRSIRISSTCSRTTTSPSTSSTSSCRWTRTRR